MQNHSNPPAERVFKGSFTYRNIIKVGISGEVLMGGEDQNTGKKVVIKRAGKRDAPEMRAKHEEDIRKEAKALKLMRGVPGVCELLDSSDKPEQTYIIMTRAPGQPLSEIIMPYKRTLVGQRPWHEWLLIFKHLTTLLVKAHDKRIVYNDVKLDHIFWHTSPRPKEFTLIDWGNVYFHQPEETVQRYTPADDIRQVGEVLYELATGDRLTLAPYRSPTQTVDITINDRDVPPELQKIIYKAVNGKLRKMGDLSREIGDLQKRLEDDFEQEIIEIKKELKKRNLSPSDLQKLLERAQAWQARATDASAAAAVIEATQKRIRQLKHQADWQIVKEEYLFNSEWDLAHPMLADLSKEAAELEDIAQIRLLETFVGWLTPHPSPPELVDATHQVLAGDNEAAIRVLVPAFQRDRNDQVVIAALIELSSRADIPLIEVYLHWLYDKLHERSGQHRKVARISGDVSDIIDKYEKIEVSIPACLDHYGSLTDSIESIRKKLEQQQVLDFASTLSRMSNGAQGITRSLKESQEALAKYDYSQARICLHTAQRLEPTSTALEKLGAAIARIEERVDLVPSLKKEEDGRVSVASFGTWVEECREVLGDLPEIDDAVSTISDGFQHVEALWKAFNDDREKFLQDMQGPLPDVPWFKPAIEHLQYLEHELKAEPWRTVGSYEFGMTMTSGVSAWRKGELEKSETYRQEAQSLVGRNYDQARQWVQWLGWLISSVRTLKSQKTCRNVPTQIAETRKETQFVEGWSQMVWVYTQSNFEDAISRVDEILRTLEFAEYGRDLRDFKERAKAEQEHQAQLEQIKNLLFKKKFKDARRSLQKMAESGKLSPGPMYQCLQCLNSAWGEGLGSLQEGNYSKAKRAFSKARGYLRTAYYPDTQYVEPLKEYVSAGDKWLSTNILRPLAQVTGYASPRNVPKLQEQMTEALDNLAKTLTNYETPIETQRQMHRKLVDVYKRDPGSFGAQLDSWKVECSNHPFMEIYEDWEAQLRRQQRKIPQPVPIPQPKPQPSPQQHVESLIAKAKWVEAEAFLTKRQSQSNFKTWYGARYLSAVQFTRRGLQELSLCKYASANSAFEAARREILSISPMYETKLQNLSRIRQEKEWEWKNAYESRKPNWEMLRHALYAINGLGTEEPGLVGVNFKPSAEVRRWQRTHENLVNAAKRGRKAYEDELNRGGSQLSSHPFGETYKRWQKQVPKQLIEESMDWVPIVTLFVILVTLIGVFLFVTARQLSHPDSDSGTPTVNIATRTPVPVATDVEQGQEPHPLQSCCEDIERMHSEQAWQEVLSIAHEAWDAHPDDFAKLAEDAPCPLEERIRDAGSELGWVQYNDAVYDDAIGTAILTRELLVALNRFNESANQEHALLTQCSVYQQNFSSGNYEEANEALMELEKLPQAYTQVRERCGFELGDAKEAVRRALTPTSTPVPTPDMSRPPDQISLLPIIDPVHWEKVDISSYIYLDAGWLRLHSLSLYRHEDEQSADLWLWNEGFDRPVLGIRFVPAAYNYNWGLVVRSGEITYRLIVEQGEPGSDPYRVVVTSGDGVVASVSSQGLPTLEICRTHAGIIMYVSSVYEPQQELYSIPWSEGATYGVYIGSTRIGDTYYPVKIKSLHALLEP